MLLVQKQPPQFFPSRATVAFVSLRYQCRHPTPKFCSIAAGDSVNGAPFSVEDYLVGSCHLTPAQAVKASKVLSHLKSSSKPDAVVAFLSGLGLSNTNIAAAVAYDPMLLCSEVERTLVPRLTELRDLGLSPSQVARLVLVDPARFRRPTIVPKLRFYISLFGSFETLLQALKSNSYLLSSDLERVVKPNVTFLMECGLDACDIAKLSFPVPRLLTTKPEYVREMVMHAEAIGVPRGSKMFRHALLAVSFLSEEKIAAKVEFLTKTFRWSDAEARVAVSKLPLLLKHSKDRLHRLSEFLLIQVGLEPEYIAHRPAMLTYSLEHRLMPRYCVVKFLKENGLLEHDRSYYSAVQMTETVFKDKFIHPFMEAAPSLDQDYAAACRGEVPIRFRFQEPSTDLANA